MEEQSAFPNISHSSYTKTTSRRPRMIVFVILFLAILGISIYIGSRFLGQSEKEKDSDKTAVAPTITLAPTDTPTPSISPTGKTKKTPTPTSKATATPRPTAKPTSPNDLDRSSLNISVQNGSGTKGAAAGMADFLKGLGYNVSSTGNADNFDYEGVTIQVKSTKNNYLQQLKKDLAGSYTVKDATTDLTASESADAVVIIGK